MKLRVGYELHYHFPQPTPVIMMLNVHYTRVSDLERPDHIVISPSVPISGYRDGFGNWCSRILAPAGDDAHLDRHGRERHRATRSMAPDAAQVPVQLASGGGTRLPPCEPVLRQRSPARSGVDPVRSDQARLGARAGHLRFRA